MYLDDHETELLLEFLNDYRDRLSNDGCNDLELKDTPQNRELVMKAGFDNIRNSKTVGEPLDAVCFHRIENGVIHTTSSSLVGYFRSRCESDLEWRKNDCVEKAG